VASGLNAGLGINTITTSTTMSQLSAFINS
jgi:hypothetical protein